MRSRKRLLPRGCGAVFSFDLRRRARRGASFIESLKLFSHLANVGDAKSLVIHPASTTHFRMSADDLASAGIGEGTIRLSIGLEDPDDLIEDLSRALLRGGQGLMQLDVAGCATLRVHRHRARSSAHRPASSSSTAPRTITASGRCSRATSRTTASTCSPSTCPATGARPGRRCTVVEAIADWLVRRCSMRRASQASTLVGHSLGALATLELLRGSPARVERIALLGPGGADGGEPTRCSTPPAPTITLAYELIIGWSHSARAPARRQSGAGHVDDRHGVASHGASIPSRRAVRRSHCVRGVRSTAPRPRRPCSARRCSCSAPRDLMAPTKAAQALMRRACGQAGRSRCRRAATR